MNTKVWSKGRGKGSSSRADGAATTCRLHDQAICGLARKQSMTHELKHITCKVPPLPFDCNRELYSC